MEARCGMPGSPTTLLRAVRQFTVIEGCLAAIGDRRRRGEFRDQQFRIVDLRHHQDLAELGGDRRLRRGLPAVCDTSDTLAPSQRTSRRNGKPATERLAQS